MTITTSGAISLSISGLRMLAQVSYLLTNTTFACNELSTFGNSLSAFAGN